MLERGQNAKKMSKLKQVFIFLTTCISVFCIDIYSLNAQTFFSKKLEYKSNATLLESCQDLFQHESLGPVYAQRIVLPKNKEISSVFISDQKIGKQGPDFSLEAAALPNYFAISWKLVQSDKKGNHFVVFVSPFRKVGNSVEALSEFGCTIETKDYLGTSKNNQSFPNTSVLSTGDIFKVAVTKDGIYKMDKSFLESLGVNTSTLNPQSINLYGNGGSMLPELNSISKPNDPLKNAIYISGEADGVFNANDYILFFGKGPDTWDLKYNSTLGRKRWLHKKHFYTDTAYYFLKIGDSDPLRIQTETNETTFNQSSNTFQDFQYLENDIYNLAKGGREFYGDLFDQVLTATYPFSFQNISTTHQASFEVAAVARTIGATSSFTAAVQGNTASTSIGFVYDSPTSLVARTGSIIQSFLPNNANCNVAVTFNKGNSEAKGWLDYILINSTRNLILSGTQMKIRDTLTVGQGNITEFNLNTTSNNIEVWDITATMYPKKLQLTDAGGIKKWTVATDTLREFIAFTNFLTPTAIGKIENQNIHEWNNIDLVIISAPPYMSIAEEIKLIHEGEGKSVAIATPEHVFNEFSSGAPDAMAFRQVMLMLKNRGDISGVYPENLLLIGDGDYSRNKGISNHRGNTIMVYESDNSLSPTSSYVSDDYFVMLSDNEDGNSTGLLDCGIGRIPCENLEEAQGYLEKLKAYLAENSSSIGGAYCVGDAQETPYGNWRNNITFVSDDQDGSGGPFESVHTNSCESLSDSVRVNHPEYDITKLYMDAFTQYSTPGGERYPDGEKGIQQRVQNGTLLMTYIGHGGERGWAHERILDIPTILSFTNKYRMPVFLTATCELARYDDPSYKSAGELLVMNKNGGAIAMLTTTRIVYTGENYEMDLAFFEHVLDEPNGNTYSLGELNMLTKNGVNPGNDSKPNFSLLGDPALKMVYPKFNVRTTHINNQELVNFNDTLKALQEVEFKGNVTDATGNTLTDFNGFIYPTVYDKESQLQTQNNDQDGEAGQVLNFSSFNKIIYRGKASVINGVFSFKFVVPIDINYTVANGRVSYYTVAGNKDGHGFSEDFKIGSVLEGAALNTVGPEIRIFMNDSTFISGGTTNTTPILIARLQDENGINTVGNGIGHNLTAILDGNTSNPIVLNDYYESDLDTYKSGVATYPLSSLSIGNHTLKVKAWDVHNNSNEAEIQFIVADDANIALSHVLNFPNPFTTNTAFMFEHNQPCQQLNVRVQIFTVSGKLVKTLERSFFSTGFKGESIPWDGKDDFGDAIGKGTYIYRLEVRNESGQRAEQYEKLVILK
jgi:hypothetical protein